MTARFLAPLFGDPKSLLFGYYKIKESYYNIEDELLLATVEKKIGFSMLHKYFECSLSGSCENKFNLYLIVKYIFSYFENYMEEKMKAQMQKVTKRAYRNGMELKQ